MSIKIEERNKVLYMVIDKNNIRLSFPLSPSDVNYIDKCIEKSEHKTNIFIKKINGIDEVMTGVNVHCNDYKLKVFIPNPVYRELCKK